MGKGSLCVHLHLFYPDQAETAVAACERSIQVHGGIGFTWEHPLHRYYKRAQWIDAFGGHAATQRAVDKLVANERFRFSALQTGWIGFGPGGARR